MGTTYSRHHTSDPYDTTLMELSNAVTSTAEYRQLSSREKKFFDSMIYAGHRYLLRNVLTRDQVVEDIVNNMKLYSNGVLLLAWFTHADDIIDLSLLQPGKIKDVILRDDQLHLLNSKEYRSVNKHVIESN
jgi:hypothetical protein